MKHTAKCRSNHLGIWAAEPGWFRQAVQAVREGTWKPMAEHSRQLDVIQVPGKLNKCEMKSLSGNMGQLYEGTTGRKVLITDVGQLYKGTGRKVLVMENGAKFVPEVFESDTYENLDGVAAIDITDFMMKGFSKYGGTSTVHTRQLIREANRDKEIESILLRIDSPGGHHFGTDELASEIRNSAKPIVAYIEDTGASAAYWAASQADAIYVNRTGMVGSIGTLAVVEDSSKMAEEMGVKVHVVSTGAYKGAGIDGTPITEEVLDETQRMVDMAFSFFAEGVKTGRGMSSEKFDSIADGRMFGAKEALSHGLVDGIGTLEQAVGKARMMASQRSRVRHAEGTAHKLRDIEVKNRIKNLLTPQSR